ncbi:P-loop NTPase fold protein [Kocuria oceani]|uniref:P-loop NTPase fold protein n=1 Tax=Kocuria oceani TaxID=988827 RepID=A0ABV9TN93_9MICC|nr:P-loop NTPase fold protein [Kocuria oceani]
MRDTPPMPSPGSPNSSQSAPAMTSLAPQYEPQHHELYFQILTQAIEGTPPSRNLALTGAYGAGKSSVLQKISETYPRRVVELSLSTLGTPAEDQAIAGEENPAAHTTTNRIQKEIVKQLLYQESPHKTPRSRFRRITSFRKRQEMWIALGFGLLITAFFFFTARPGPLVEVAGTEQWQVLLTTFALFIASSAVVYSARWLSNGRMTIEKVAAGPATVTLSPQSTSYFDEYLDEIMYYFEISERDIVIFEDIDRFDDAHIFETLRALNTLLNSAKQIENKPIKFIYALRDSVFERLGLDDEDTWSDEAHTEIRRANRTKFFDLVVPVVPFLTHRNARDLMAREMSSDEYMVSHDLIDIAARHVADMRLIRNIRNEFEVFRRRLLMMGSTVPGLDVDRLFAIVLYKNIHMSDFESLRIATSNLDSLYKAWRRLVSVNIEELTQQDLEIRNNMRITDTADHRAARLAEKLRDAAALLALSWQLPNRSPRQAQITVNNVTVDTLEMSTANFWIKLVSAQSAITVTLPSPYGSAVFNFPLEGLQELLGETLDPRKWEQVDREATNNERERIAADIDFLQHHDWNGLYHRPEFTLPVGDLENDGVRTFRQLTQEILTSHLAQDLVAHGYLNAYFGLYVSPFYGKLLRPDALNYVMHHVDRGEPEMLYKLEADDVDAIIRDQGVSVLGDRSMYNVSVMDHLLTTRIKDADRVVRELLTWGSQERQFLDRYMAHGQRPPALISLLAQSWQDVFAYVVERAPVDDRMREVIFDAALTAWVNSVAYNLDSPVRKYIETNYPSFLSLSNPASSQHAEHAMYVVAAAKAQLNSVTPLTSEARKAAIKTKSYAVTAENLSTLTGSEDIALDTLRTRNADVYDHALEHLSGYVKAVRTSSATPYTVATPTDFTSIINDAATRDADGTLTLIAEASPNCTVENITDVIPEAWPALAGNTRVPSTFTNIDAYLRQIGEIDVHLAAVLKSSGRIVDVQGADLDALTGLATAIINANESLPEAALRVRLVDSLGLDYPLRATSIEPESGELVGLLLEHRLITDDTEAFSHDLMVDWPTREAAIAKSRQFGEFMTPEHAPIEHLPELMSSARIPNHVKRRILDNLADYTDGAGMRTYQAITDYAVHSGWTAGYNQIEILRNGGVAPESLICLLAESGETINTDNLREILRRIGGNYAVIADQGTQRPKIPDTPEHRAILNRLKDEDVVASYRPDRDPLLLRVHMKKG